MSNVLTPGAREGFLGATLDWDADTFKIVLLDSTYVYSSGHDFLDDIGGGSIIATSSALASKTKTGGVADSDPAVFVALAGGDTVTQVWLYKDTGSSATSTLVAYYDTDGSAVPISLATNGEDLTVQPNASGWFSL